MKSNRWLQVVFVMGISLFFLMLFFVFISSGSASKLPSPQTPDTLPDLAITSLILQPPNPHTTEPATITIKAQNVGTVSVPGRRVYLYIDPPLDQRPPLTTTTPTTSWIVGLEWPPGDTITMEYSEFTFTEPGCNHVVYAWVDPLKIIDETNEANNLMEVQVCVEDEITTGGDEFEIDDICDPIQTPEILTDGTKQVRNFYPVGDQDYVKFFATAGITYTITAAGTGSEAWPYIEMADSCDIPSSFGTNSRLAFMAPGTGWYYMKLQNNRDSTDPKLSTYELTIHKDQIGETPQVLALSPTSGFNDRNTNIVITGTQFSFPPLAEVCTFESVTCTNTCFQLLDTSWVNPQQLFGIVPANLDTGPYCLSVTNPGGKTDVLPNAFNIYPNTPDPRTVVPSQGFNDLPSDVHVYGFNFLKGITATIGGLQIENIKVINRTHFVGILPAGLSPGKHDLVASYPIGDAGTLSEAYTAIPSTDDLYAQAQELWMDPAVPRAGRLVNLGLYVHRFGGDEPIIDLPVQFTANGQPIGTAYIPGLSPNDEQSTIPLQWIPTQAGGITLVATIDPDHNISEATLSNNTITRTITVISGGTDVQPPHVDALLIFGGTQTTTNPLVSLDTTVIDYPLSPDASGISELRFVEFEYNSAARLWIPIQDTQWLSATNALNDYPFTINEVGGVHYIQAWAKDQVGNVSHYPFQAPINYLAPTDAVGSEQTRIYRQTLSAGQTLQVHLTPKSGDPDLYIWAPDWGSGRPPWVSDQPGLGEELISFTAPVDGIYQIEVFGYSYSDYEITIQQGTQYSDLVKSITPPSSTTKTVPDDPSISPINVPPRPSPIEADFYTDSVIGKVPLTAAFLDTSIGLVTGWDWDFGDGKSSAEQNPMHVYTSTGLYTVKLTVTGPDGADSLERIAYIWVLPQTGSIIYLPEVVR